ncbi:homeobox protein 5-like isoform X2 [Musca domestica]|uniref:Homeobox protein 5-like isoform X2 n=1 Tax=Musca domestica TaxID=7370 RepID=A0ABM3VP16_MUSDO|nr:homeobox protein 5-like isoform X2 [Musca domestica]
MGKCISKNPTSLTIALSEKDLATASHILSKFNESSEYIALKDKHRNQLCEYFAVNDACAPSNGSGEVVVVHRADVGPKAKGHLLQAHRCEHIALDADGQQVWHLSSQQENNHENTCLHSPDHGTAVYRLPNKSNDAFENNVADDNDDDNNAAQRNDDCNDYGDVIESVVDDDSSYTTIAIVGSGDSCHHSDSLTNKYFATMSIIDNNGDSNNNNITNLANNNHHHRQSTNNNNYFVDVPQNLTELLLYHHHHRPHRGAQDDDTTQQAVLAMANRNQHREEQEQECPAKRINSSKKKLKKSKEYNYVEDAENSTEQSAKGQTESKRHSKKHNAGEIQTKGTAMSFGFRKNLNTTPKKLKKLLKGENGKKKQDKCNNVCTNDTEADISAEQIDSAGYDTADNGTKFAQTNAGNDGKSTTGMTTTNPTMTKDDNGNADLLNNVHFDKMGAVAANNLNSGNTSTVTNNTTGLLTGVGGGGGGGNGNVLLPGAGSRFGYRGPIRPSSTDITSRCKNETNDNVEKNNNATAGNNIKGQLVSNLKRRSKSAHAGRTPSTSNESDTEASAAPRATQPKTITFNLKQNSTIEYDRRQFFEQPSMSGISGRHGYGGMANSNVITTGMHNNVILRPTARLPLASTTTAPATTTATAYTKYTLQTVSLPKPEFAVPISINVSTPTTPASTSYNSSSSTSSRPRDNSWNRPQHPLTVAQSTAPRLDSKAAKHMTNSTRRTFSGSREISADSGIASLDMALDSSGSSRMSSGAHKSSPKRSRSRPRNLQMVMNGRHRFEVRDLDDSLSSGDSSIVEPLALPKLPTENQTVPLPLSGLIRSNTVLSRESYESRNAENKQKQTVKLDTDLGNISQSTSRQASEEDSEFVDEEKLHLDRSATEKGAKERQFKDINTCSSKTSSPGSSIISSWCNAGESLAANDFSTLSLDSSEDSNKQDNKLLEEKKESARNLSFEINDDDLVTLNTDVQISTLSSLTEPVTLNDEIDALPKESTKLDVLSDNVMDDMVERPKTLCNSLNETKFAEMALEGSTFLLDDETSPTDSLVSSSESEGAACKQKKHKINEELQEKDIDEISPELDLASPLSPGTPTHCSRSLSLSDCGNLIDDEIADQPALLFNQESQDGGAESGASRRDRTDTPTLMESLSSLRNSIHSQTNRSRSALYQAMELSLRTPLSVRKAVMERAESLDTLSPCESICSDDLMMDFDMASSMDSIDRSVSIKSRSGSDLNKIDDSELFSELDRKGSDVMKELNNLLRNNSKKNKDRDITAHLPARATRLLNRSRMQQHCTLNNDNDSDSTRSPLSSRRHHNTATSSRNSTVSSVANNYNNQGNNSSGNNTASSSLQRRHQKQKQHQHHHPASSSSSAAYHQHQRDTHSSSDDLMLYDKSFRNAMIQDVLQFKKQLLRLRKILQENENCLTRTETLNPFENDNGQLFTSCGLDSKLLDDIDLASLTSSTTDDPVQELSDLRRQGQVDDRDRTIRLQKNLIEQLEAEKHKTAPTSVEAPKECVTTATQTERTRPLSIGMEGLSRSKPEYTSYTTYFPALNGTTVIQQQHHNSGQQNPGNMTQNNNNNNQTRRHTVISTTLSNYNQQMFSQPTIMNSNKVPERRASIAWDKPIAPSYKPVKITLIGDPLKQWSSSGCVNKSQPKCEEEEEENVKNCNSSNGQQKQREYHEKQYEQISKNTLINGKCKSEDCRPVNTHSSKPLQDIVKANELFSQTTSVPPTQHQPKYQQHPYHQHQNHAQQHHHHHSHSHHHNNHKPTVTIV